MTQGDQLPITRAVGTVRLASEFLSAARLQDFDRMPPSMVTYFLVGHCLELAFKSILIAHGTSEQALRTLGHDLLAALNAAKKVAPAGVLDLEEYDCARLAGLAPFYHAKALEYLEPGFMSLPLARDLCDLADRVLQPIKGLVEKQVRSSLAESRAV